MLLANLWYVNGLRSEKGMWFSTAPASFRSSALQCVHKYEQSHHQSSPHRSATSSFPLRFKAAKIANFCAYGIGGLDGPRLANSIASCHDS
jgi:hypothetical protein